MKQEKYKTVPRVCLYCNSAFMTRPYDVRRGQGKYCSRSCSDAAKRRPVQDRFWSRVKMPKDPDGCWIWKGAKSYGREYGQFTSPFSRTVRYAHRVAWELTHGPIPKGLMVCHNCPGGDNPSCVRPDHMFLGTTADNTRDAAEKGLLPRGEKNPSAKLTENDVREIRRLYATGQFTHKQLAERFGMTTTPIRRAINRKTWKHVL